MGKVSSSLSDQRVFYPCFFSLVAFVAAIYFFTRAQSNLAPLQFAKGVISDLEKENIYNDNGDFSMTVLAVGIKFQTKTGKLIYFTQKLPLGSGTVGDEVSLRYLIKDPYQARIESFYAPYSLSIALISLSAFLFLFGFLAYRGYSIV